MPRIKLTIEYDGTQYGGWQLQKNTKTVQGEIENALHILFKKRIALTGSGRTDTGVHARNQCAHCDIPENRTGENSEFEPDKLKKSINALLEKDIVIKKVEIARENFHSRYDAISRIYKYYITKNPTSVGRNFSWYISYPLNLTLMQIAAEDIAGINDFQSFCKTGSSNKTTKCTIKESRWIKKSDLLIYEIEANRFLYGMVRGIVGTIVSLGSAKINYEMYREILLNKLKKGVSFMAPPKGLFLEHIKYK
jgi:tRNA pseudouridine38-40 synthase